MNKSTANKVYDILVLECGAKEDEREHFIQVQTSEQVLEWRFCGRLGFGGKFWRQGSSYFTGGEQMTVDCYPEDETPERKAMIETANAQLKAL
jgi:hypothetical protein